MNVVGRTGSAAPVVRLGRVVLIAFLAAPSIASLGAQTLPTPQQLAERHDSLVGGRAGLDSYQSVRMLGSFAIPMMGIDAPLEVLKVKPNRFLTRTSLGPLGESLSGYDGSTAWAIQPGQPPMVFTGDQAAQVREQADFFGDLHDLSRFVSTETVEITDFAGSRAYRVRMVRQNGDTLNEYFDVQSGLSAGSSSSVTTPIGRVELSSEIGDYKQFGGLRFATRIQQKNPQFDIILTIVSVEFDTIDAQAVAVPESIRELIKP